MLGQEAVPFVAQDSQEVQGLLDSLNQHSSKGGRPDRKTFSCKKSTFKVASSPQNLTVDSWRFQDWDYKRSDLPTYARGLFTTKNEKGEPEIAIRGYDKFFNINEVSTTKWKNIEENTKGPYELSLKENGCIIFISGLHDDSLLVCSKHSTGARGDTELSHAIAGEKWVDRQLSALGKTRKDLARELRKRNVTAVAELCDDDFEEHILAYTKEDAGLYLHGINVNVPEFTTYPGNQVHAFADEWGFKKVQYLMHDTIQSARTFLESVAETGSYNGRDVEGFVIRCKARVSANAPYTDWFFKYKFEEPYLMYRQWRECTKSLISGKPPKFRKHVKVTENYLRYVRRRLAADKSLGEAYQQNHGIIGLRNDFLKEINMKGADLVQEEYGIQKPGEISKDVILVPIATIGCGKTTVAFALQRLFGWGLIQNDNITGKARPPRFTGMVLEELTKAPVVFADRNNSGSHERKQIIEDVHRLNPEARLIALHFVHSPERMDALRKITQDRVLARGDNHQTLQASSDEKKVLGIMDNFVKRFEPVNANRDPDDGFDMVIDLDPAADSRQNLETVITELHNTYPKLFPEDMPSSTDLDDAIDYALNSYKPDLRHEVGGRVDKAPRPAKQQQNPAKANNASQKKKRPLEYVAVTLPVNRINAILEAVFRPDPEKASFFRQLQQNNRVQTEFHVTLMHRASAKANQQLWERYSNLHSEAGGGEDKLGDCKVLLERVVWDDRIMAIVARLVDENWECTNSIAHITVGTKGPDVKPKESNNLLQEWLNVGTEGTGIGEIAVDGRVILDGVVKGVLSR